MHNVVYKGTSLVLLTYSYIGKVLLISQFCQYLEQFA